MTVSETERVAANHGGLHPLQKLGTVEAIKLGFLNHIKYTLATDEFVATHHDKYVALAMTIRDRLIERWIATAQTYHERNVKRVYYLSMEFLIGRAMGNNIICLGLDAVVKQAMEDLGLDWSVLREVEPDAALGNGGLGRLAACFLDSMATLSLPGYGYGIRYEYGLFRQEIRDGRQVEEPDHWLRHGDPWQIERPEFQFPVGFGGTVRHERGAGGRLVVRWSPAQTVLGVPFDFPIAGYHNQTVNNLRLWTAKATEEFNLTFFNHGQYIQAYQSKILGENITKVLYPNDLVAEGRELRLQQEYFFVSCSLQDILRRFSAHNPDPRTLPDQVAVQLNDTHPSLAVAELMRLLVDERGLDWEPAWDAAQAVFGYTNHTLMPEAMERWPVALFEEFLPRHLEIIYEINRRFLRQVRTHFPDDSDRLRRMSIIEEGAEKRVRMAHLSVVGSHATNGVSQVHSELVKSRLFPDFYALWPERFLSITNGITQRRWLLKANPGLAELITQHIGDDWVTDLYALRRLRPLVDDAGFRSALAAVKRANKVRLADHVRQTLGITVDPDSLFDTQAKRLHEYKRQLLALMHACHRYARLKADPSLDLVPRTFLFAAKAAPGYQTAKLIIKLINDFAAVVNRDPQVADKMKVVFLPDYRVSLAERIIPATDLSEQVSLAGTEASGTGNMKFALNGAVTIGTLDGANIEIREEVGEDQFFLFGHTVEEIERLRRPGAYNAWDVYRRSPALRQILDYLGGDFFNLEEPGLYRPLYESLLAGNDPYFHLADFPSYVQAQDRVDQTYRDTDQWGRMAIANIAGAGKFSSDRAVAQYAEKVWGVRPCIVDVPEQGRNRTWYPEDRVERRVQFPRGD